jgi:predicted nucleotide-binding protein (sugar kinase/HSP70/actin superfamily)
MLKEKFKDFFEFEDYQEMIKHTKILITASPQAILESLASGGMPIYFQREDYEEDFLKLFNSLGVPVIKNYDTDKLKDIIDSLSYKNYKRLEKNCYKIANFIKKASNL